MLLASIAVCFVGLALSPKSRKKEKKKETEKSDDSCFCASNWHDGGVLLFTFTKGVEGWSVVIDCDGFFSIIRRFHSDGGLDQRRFEVWSGPCLFEKGRCGTI